MSVIVHQPDATDVPAGEAQIVLLGPGLPAPDLARAAEAGTLLLFATEGNVATGDPTGDGYALADALDGLDLNRRPIPPLAIRLDPQQTRENLATAMSYLATWADAVAARGYAPWIWTSPDVIWEAAKAEAHFSGAYAVAFQPSDASSGAPVPDPRQVPGLPADTFTGARAFAYGTNGETVADEGVLATAVAPDPPAPEPSQGQAAPDGGAVSPEDYQRLKADFEALSEQLTQLAEKQQADAASNAEQLQALQDYVDQQLTELGASADNHGAATTKADAAGGPS